jgi:hypothetical protein
MRNKMKEYTLRTKNLSSKNKLKVYKITYPKGHYNGAPFNDKISFEMNPYKPDEDAPTELDKGVVSEPVVILYPDYLEVRKEVLVPATKKRILHRASFFKNEDE